MLRLSLPILLLVFALPAAAQPVPAVGTDATFDVATWNVVWFGAANGPSDDERQLDHVEAVIEGAAVDLWALQEVADVGYFGRLLDSLGTGYAGLYRDNTSAGVTQRLAFVYRTDVVRVRSAEQILRDFSQGSNNAFASRPPLKLDVEVTLPDTTVTLSVVTVHMKALSDLESYERRQEAALRLKNRIDGLHGGEPFILMGDFNDELGSSIAGGRTTPYDIFLQDPDDYRFLTLAMDEANVPTYCSNGACSSGSTLDHILITDELFDAYVDGSAGRFIELTQAISGFVFNTSDHLPVYARFAFAATGTAVEAGVPPRVPVLGPVYPNPVRDRATLRFVLDRADVVRLEVYDLLGRRVAVAADGYRAAGAHEVTFDVGALPEGVYLVRMQADGFTAVRRFVRLR